MTRINLVPPSELMDQHLFAEFREIKMVAKSLRRSVAARGVAGVQAAIPKEFTLGTGHVFFFYDKGGYLVARFEELRKELSRRGINYDRGSLLDADGVFATGPWLGGYSPTPAALQLIRARIADRIAMKPQWYRKTL